MSPAFSINSSTQVLSSSNIDMSTSIYNTVQNSTCFYLSSLTLESGASITLMPLYEDSTTILEISQSILDCIGKD
jgi:hypothetical protein